MASKTMSRIFRSLASGLRNDVRNRLPFYMDDWTCANRAKLRCVTGLVLVFVTLVHLALKRPHSPALLLFAFTSWLTTHNTSIAAVFSPLPHSFSVPPPFPRLLSVNSFLRRPKANSLSSTCWYPHALPASYKAAWAGSLCSSLVSPNQSCLFTCTCISLQRTVMI
jgi:hypothetical protein